MPPLKAPKTASQFYALGSLAIVLALLYFGQEVLIPLALAVLIAFLLAPVVGWLERLRLGRVPSTLLVVVVALALVGGFGWIVEQRFVEIVNRLPEYRLLPKDVQPGEVLALLNCGAYSLAQASQYNGRFLPAVVLIRENGNADVIRRRDSFEDLVNNDVY